MEMIQKNINCFLFAWSNKWRSLRHHYWKFWNWHSDIQQIWHEFQIQRELWDLLEDDD